MRRTIPQIRARLLEIADEKGIPELAELAEETKREYHGRRAAPTRRSLTPALAAKIRSYARAHPRAAYHDMAERFHTNIGRVSEALFGKRGATDG